MKKVLFFTSAVLSFDCTAVKAESDVEIVQCDTDDRCSITLLEDIQYVESMIKSMEDGLIRGKNESWRELMDVVAQGSLSQLAQYKADHPEKYQEGLVRPGDKYSVASHFIGYDANTTISAVDREEIAKMLLRDTGPDSADNGGWTPIMYAAHAGKKELVKFAVQDCHSQTASTAINFQGKNAAYFALTSGRCSWADRKEMLEVLGGTTSYVSGYNDNLLHLLLGSVSHRAFKPEDREARLAVLQTIADSNSKVRITQKVAAYDTDGYLLSQDGTTMVYADCFTGKIIREIEVERSLLDQQNSAGETALHVAARHDDIDAAVVLLNAGANPNIVSGGASVGGRDGYIPLGVQGKTALSYFSADGLSKLIHSVSATTLQRVRKTLNERTTKEIMPQLQRLREEGLWK